MTTQPWPTVQTRALNRGEAGALHALAASLPFSRSRGRWRQADGGPGQTSTLGLNWSIEGVILGRRTDQPASQAFTRTVHATVARHFPGFTYTTGYVNRHFPGHLHTDGHNVGPSVMLTVGSPDPDAGELWYGGSPVPTRNRALQFDGLRPHVTRPYTSTRYPVVYFTFGSWRLARADDLRRLRRWGYQAHDLPEFRCARTRSVGQRSAARLREAWRTIRRQVGEGLLPRIVLSRLVEPPSDATYRRAAALGRPATLPGTARARH